MYFGAKMREDFIDKFDDTVKKITRFALNITLILINIGIAYILLEAFFTGTIQNLLIPLWMIIISSLIYMIMINFAIYRWIKSIISNKFLTYTTTFLMFSLNIIFYSNILSSAFNIMTFKVPLNTEILKNNPLLIVAMGLVIMQVVSLVNRRDIEEDEEEIIIS